MHDESEKALQTIKVFLKLYNERRDLVEDLKIAANVRRMDVDDKFVRTVMSPLGLLGLVVVHKIGGRQAYELQGKKELAKNVTLGSLLKQLERSEVSSVS